ncbi:glycosyltransferase [bacterium]|nr:glycosyltransferase [bacterium]
MVSLIIPTYRNPECLDICLKSVFEGQANENQIIVSVDGFYEESLEVLSKYPKVQVLPSEENKGMQMALNLGVMNAINERIVIINDDNVLCKDWDIIIEEDLKEGNVLTINQIEPHAGIFDFSVKDFGTNPKDFKYDEFIKYEQSIRKDKLTYDGGIFPFAMWKKDYMIVGGFDTLYQSPFICDWDFFLKLDLNGLKFVKTHRAHFYHFVSMATKKGVNKEEMSASENPAKQTFIYKWGIYPNLFTNNSHNPKNGETVKGIKFN